MKHLFVLIASLALTLTCSAETRLIPLDEFEVNVTTSEKGGSYSMVEVTLSISRTHENPKGMAQLRIECPDFPLGNRDMTEEDLAALRKVADAAAAERELEVTTETTHYRSLYDTGFWVVWATRGEAEAEFAPDEPEYFERAIQAAEPGLPWYQALLESTENPEATPEMHPPIAQAYSVLIPVNQDSFGDLDIGVVLFCERSRHLKPRPGISTLHQFQFQKVPEHRGLMTPFDLVIQLSEALESAHDGKPGSFGAAMQNGRYRGYTNRETGKVDLFVYTNGSEVFGTAHFEHRDIVRLRRLEEGMGGLEKWFEENSGLFFQTP